MQTTQHALGRLAVVVLHKAHIQARALGKVTRIETLIKESPRIAKHLGLKDQNFGDGGRGDGVRHLNRRSAAFAPT